MPMTPEEGARRQARQKQRTAGMVRRHAGEYGRPVTNAGGARPASSQADALLNPSPVSGTTPVHPYQAEAYSRAAGFESGLANLTNEEITRELGRARDEISTGMRAEGEAAMSRGADPTLFRTRALQSGARDISNLQGRLADVALGRRQDAINAMTGAGAAAAGEQRLTHFASLAQRLADNRLLLDQADLQSRLYAAPYERMMSMGLFATNPSVLGAVGGGFGEMGGYNPELPADGGGWGGGGGGGGLLAPSPYQVPFRASGPSWSMNIGNTRVSPSAMRRGLIGGGRT